MEIGGLILWGVVAVVVLALVYASGHHLWKIGLEHCFRKYGEWRLKDIARGVFKVSVIGLQDSGEVSIRLEHSGGYCIIYWKLGDPIEKLKAEIVQHALHLGWKGQKYFIVDFGGFSLSIQLPTQSAS